MQTNNKKKSSSLSNWLTYYNQLTSLKITAVGI